MEADSFEHQRVTHIRVSMGNRLCTLGFQGDQGTPFPYKSFMLKRLPLIPRIQWVAWRTVPVTGAGAVQGRQCTIPVATRWHVLPIPVHVGERQAPETYRFRCNQGQKGSVMHRFRGYRGKLDAKKYQVPPRFPRLRGCTRPIVNSWVKFFPWGTGEGVPFWACRLSVVTPTGVVGCHSNWRCRLSLQLALSVVKQNRHAAGTWVGTWSWPLRGVRGFRGFNMMVMTSGLFQPHLVCTPFPPSQAKSTRGHSTGDVST